MAQFTSPKVGALTHIYEFNYLDMQSPNFLSVANRPTHAGNDGQLFLADNQGIAFKVERGTVMKDVGIAIAEKFTYRSLNGLSAVLNSNNVTFTTQGDHDLSNGDVVTIAGVTFSGTNPNGTSASGSLGAVANASGNTFTVSLTGGNETYGVANAKITPVYDIQLACRAQDVGSNVATTVGLTLSSENNVLSYINDITTESEGQLIQNNGGAYKQPLATLLTGSHTGLNTLSSGTVAEKGGEAADILYANRGRVLFEQGFGGYRPAQVSADLVYYQLTGAGAAHLDKLVSGSVMIFASVSDPLAYMNGGTGIGRG